MYLNPYSKFKPQFPIWLQFKIWKLILEKALSVCVVIADVKSFQIAGSIRFHHNIKHQCLIDLDSSIEKCSVIPKSAFKVLFPISSSVSEGRDDVLLLVFFFYFHVYWNFQWSKTETLRKILDLDFWACCIFDSISYFLLSIYLFHSSRQWDLSVAVKLKSTGNFIKGTNEMGIFVVFIFTLSVTWSIEKEGVSSFHKSLF